MKEVEECSLSTYVTPRRKRRRRGTDFSNRKARQRRQARRRVELENEFPSTPVKGQVEGFSLKFCSIRKLVLQPLVESEEELIEDTIADQQDPDNREGKGPEMTGGRRLQRKRTRQSLQPAISGRDSPSTEVDCQSSEQGDSETVSLVSQSTDFIVKLYIVTLIL